MFVELDGHKKSLLKKKHVDNYRVVTEHSLYNKIHELFIYIISQELVVIIHECWLLIFVEDGKESKDGFINRLVF